VNKKFKHKTNDVDIKEILTKGFSFLLFRAGGFLAGYLFTYFIAKLYGASVYGLVALCFSLFVFSSIFGRLGVDINLVKFYSKEGNGNDKGLFFRVLIKSFVVSSLLACLLYVFKDFFIFKLFKKPQLDPYIIWVVLAVPFWSITLVCAGLLRAKKINNWFAFLNNPGRFLFSLFAFFILWAIVDEPLNAIKAHFYGVFFLSILAFLISVKTLQGITFKTNQNSWLFIKEAFPMMLSSTILILLGWLDTFFLGIYETDDVVGVYNVALKIAALTGFSLQAINSILAPKVAASFQNNDIISLKKMVQFSTQINFYITLGIVLFIIIFHKWILGIFGNEFIAGSLFLIVLCIGQLINSMSGSVGVILQMTGYQKVFQNIVLMALVLNVILNVILIPLYGGLGAAIATVVSISSWNITGAFYLKLKMNIKSYFSFKK
jgi:O-antigen/teichoic acid export membrane protein